MYTESCDLEGKKGVKELDRNEPYAVIANRELHERGQSGKFAVVNVDKEFVNSVHTKPAAAKSIVEAMRRS
jgi:hypothetical protein